MGRVHFIYSLVDPRTGCVRYVGKSTLPKQRCLQHIKHAREGGSTHRDFWIRSLVRAGVLPEVVIIKQCTDECWQDCERSAIASFDNLTNHTAGGESAGGNKWTPEARAAFSAKKKAEWAGRKASGALLENLVKGQRLTPEQRERKSETMKKHWRNQHSSAEAVSR